MKQSVDNRNIWLDISTACNTPISEILSEIVEDVLDEVPHEVEDEAGEDGHDGVDGDPVLVVDGEEVHEGRDVAADDAHHVHRQPRHQQVGSLTVSK